MQRLSSLRYPDSHNQLIIQCALRVVVHSDYEHLPSNLCNFMYCFVTEHCGGLIPFQGDILRVKNIHTLGILILNRPELQLLRVEDNFKFWVMLAARI